MVYVWLGHTKKVRNALMARSVGDATVVVVMLHVVNIHLFGLKINMQVEWSVHGDQILRYICAKICSQGGI